MGVLLFSPRLNCKREKACQGPFETSKNPRGTGSVAPGPDRQGRLFGVWPPETPAPQQRGPFEHRARACAVHFAKLSLPWEWLVFYAEVLSLRAPLQAKPGAG